MTARTGSSPRTSRSYARPATCWRPFPRSSAARGSRWPTCAASSGGWPTERRPPRSPRTCTSTGRGWSPTCTGRAIARSTGCSRRPRRARCSRPATARRATTCPCCCPPRRPSASRVATASPATRCSAVSRPSGPDSGCTRWTPRIRPRPRSSTCSCRATPRATRSDDTVLNGAFIPDRYVARTLPAGTVDAFILGIFGWALLNFANIYYAIALRARDLAVASARKKTSLAVSRAMAYHPEVQHAVAEMTLALDSVGPHVESVAQDWANGVDHGAAWPGKIVSAKYHAVEAAKRVVDLAMDISGGAGMFKANELERLYRDVRCGGFHPANSALVHEIVGKTTLGIDLGEQPRWG